MKNEESVDRCATAASPEEQKVYEAIATNYSRGATTAADKMAEALEDLLCAAHRVAGAHSPSMESDAIAELDSPIGRADEALAAYHAMKEKP